MSKTYVAWNDKEYPWPPPDGWYLASDNKWWAKDSGPGPKEATKEAVKPDALSESPTRVASPNPQDQAGKGTGDQANAGSSAPFNSAPQQTPFGGAAQNPQQSGQRTPFGSQPAPGQPAQGQSAPGQPAAFGQPAQGQSAQGQSAQGQSGPGQPAAFGQPQQYPQNNWQSTPGNNKKSKTGLIVGLLGGGAALLLLLIGLILFVSRDSEGDPVAVSITTTSTTVEPTTTTSTTVTPTTEEPTTTTEAEVDFEAATAGFRAHLSSIGVDSSEVTDEQLQLSGLGTCFSAVLAQTPADWEAMGPERIDEAVQSQIDAGVADPLTRDQWDSIFDARLVFYCPDEATRLAVTL